MRGTEVPMMGAVFIRFQVTQTFAVILRWRQCTSGKAIAAKRTAALWSKFVSNNVSWKFGITIYQRAAKIGRLHHATQLFSEVRRNSMAIVQAILADYKFALRLENYQVRVVTGAGAAFSRPPPPQLPLHS